MEASAVSEEDRLEAAVLAVVGNIYTRYGNSIFPQPYEPVKILIRFERFSTTQKIMKHITLIIILFALSFSAFGQGAKGQEFTDGWVATKKGDTLRGKVCYENTKTGERLEKVVFIDSKDATNAKKRYGSEKLTAFGAGGKVFEWVILEDGIPPLIMERVVGGDLSLYRCWFKTMDSTPQKMTYEVGMFLKKKDNPEFYEVMDKKFQKEMAAYFKGDEAIVKMIKEKEYTIKDIDKIVQAYNELE